MGCLATQRAEATPITPVYVQLDVNLNDVSFYTILFGGEHFYIHQGGANAVYIQTDNGSNTGAYTGSAVSNVTYLNLYPVGTVFGPTDGLPYTQKNSSSTLVTATLDVVGLKTVSGDYGYAVFDAMNDGVHLIYYGYQTTANTPIKAVLPEPASLAVLAGGVATLGAVRRKRASATA